MKNRTALSSRTRFEIFKRDGFRCVYCGATPVEAVLHVDHVKPVADGGDNNPTNLVTACQSCNGGKAAVPLSEKRLGPTRTPEEAADHAKQILAYLEAERGVVAAKVAVRDEIAEVWSKEVGYSARASECAYLARCASEFGVGKVIDAIRIAVARIEPHTEYQAGKCYRYFCGIIKRWRETGNTNIGRQAKHEESGETTPVEDLLRWLGRNTPCCDLCERDDEHDEHGGVRPFTIINISGADLMFAQNIVFLCGSCVQKHRAVFTSVEGLKCAGVSGTPRRLFFDRVARNETTTLMETIHRIDTAKGESV